MFISKIKAALTRLLIENLKFEYKSKKRLNSYGTVSNDKYLLLKFDDIEITRILIEEDLK